MLRTELLAPSLLCLTLSACAPSEMPGFDDDGAFSLLTYNVAALPQGISQSDPVRYIPMISPLLNDIDVVLVQEDFAYQAELRTDLTHPWQSWPKEPELRTVGDGLNRFSRLQFPLDVTRAQWDLCNGLTDNGADCFAEKGFSYAPLFVTNDIIVDVYNLHMDASSSPEDREARRVQVDQLLAFIDDTSTGRAVIVAGDTNLSFGKDIDNESLLDALLTRAGLTDACDDLACPDVGRIDRVMLRSGDDVELAFTSWSVDERFVDEEGGPLSDHEAVRVDISWARR